MPIAQALGRRVLTADDVIGRAGRRQSVVKQAAALAQGMPYLNPDRHDAVLTNFKELRKSQLKVDRQRMEAAFGLQLCQMHGVSPELGLCARAEQLGQEPESRQPLAFSVLVSTALTFNSPEKVGLCLNALTDTSFFKEDPERAMKLIHKSLRRLPDASEADRAHLAQVVTNISVGASKERLHPAVQFYTNKMLVDRVKNMPSEQQLGMLEMLTEQAAKFEPTLKIGALGQIATAAVQRLDSAHMKGPLDVLADEVKKCSPDILPKVSPMLIAQVEQMPSKQQSDVLTLLAEQAAKLEPRVRMGILGDVASAAIERLDSVHMKAPLNILADHVGECTPQILPTILCGLVLQDLAKDDVSARRPGRQLEPNDRADMMIKLAGKLGECQDKTKMFDMLHGMSINYSQNQIPVERKLSILEALSEQLPKLDSGVTKSAVALLNESDKCPESQDRSALLYKVDEFAKTSEKLKLRVYPDDPSSVTWGEVIRLEHVQPRREIDAVARYVPD
jgi:hypothetical protein